MEKSAGAVLLGGGDKGAEQGVCLIGPGFQLRVELYPHEPGVAGQLHDLHQPPVGGQAGQLQPRLGQGIPVFVVELVAVTVPLGDLLGS